METREPEQMSSDSSEERTGPEEGTGATPPEGVEPAAATARPGSAAAVAARPGSAGAAVPAKKGGGMPGIVRAEAARPAPPPPPAPPVVAAGAKKKVVLKKKK